MEENNFPYGKDIRWMKDESEHEFLVIHIVKAQ